MKRAIKKCMFFQTIKEFMKIKVICKRPFGKEGFYPCDTWTKEFCSALHPRSTRAKSFSRRQMEILKKLGFEIEIESERIEL